MLKNSAERNDIKGVNSGKYFGTNEAEDEGVDSKQESWVEEGNVEERNIEIEFATETEVFKRIQGKNNQI